MLAGRPTCGQPDIVAAPGTSLTVEPFTPLTTAVRDALAGEAAGTGRFFGLDLAFEVAPVVAATRLPEVPPDMKGWRSEVIA